MGNGKVARLSEDAYSAVLRSRGIKTKSKPQSSVPQDVLALPSVSREENTRKIFRSKLEENYARYLHGLLLAGDILQYRYEPLRFQLAPNTTITPDFQVKLKDGSYEFHETKGGFVREDAIAKLKICARLYPEWRFVMVQRKRGAWELRELPV